MDKIDTDELRRIAAEATPGPWSINRGGACEADEIVSGIWSVAFVENYDSPLIALAPDLADEVIAARAREADLQARLDEARAAWEAYDGALFLDDYLAALARVRAALSHPASGEGAA